MKVISNKPLVHITPEEEKAIKIVAGMFDYLNDQDIPFNNTEIESSDDLLDFFFDNDCFNCEIESEE